MVDKYTSGVIEDAAAEDAAAAERELFSLMGTRRGKLGALTRKSNTITALMKDGNKETAEKQLNELDALLAEFMQLHVSIQSYLSPEEQEQDHVDWYEPKLMRFKTLMATVKEWLSREEADGDGDDDDDNHDEEEDEKGGGGKAVMAGVSKAKPTAKEEVTPLGVRDGAGSKVKATPKEEEDDEEDVGPGDSVSQLGSSTTSSALRRATAERAALRAKAAILSQRHELDMEEANIKAKLKARRERLELEGELAAADARIQVLTEGSITSRSSTRRKRDPTHSASTPTEYYLPTPNPTRNTACMELLVQQQAQQQAQPNTTHTAQPPQQQHDLRHMDGQNIPSVLNAADQTLVSVMGKQQDITEIMVKQLQQSLLPSKEIPTFCGDPLQYRSFIRAFEHGIEARTDNDQDRLYYLEQFTTGQPKELVRSCLHMDPTKGYKQAKEQLEWNFGNEMKITTAYVNKALNWSTIRAEDGQALRAYALFLRGCCNTMADVQHLEELDNPSNLKIIASKLPFRLRDKWRIAVCDFQDKRKKRVRFENLVEFVERQARIALEPVFGDVTEVTSTDRRGLKAKPSDAMRGHKPTSRGSSFATSLTSLPEDSAGTFVEQHQSKLRPTQDSHSTAFHKPCLYCNGDHAMALCGKMKNLSNNEKVKFLRDKGLCFGCLTRGHMSKDCRKRLTCPVCQQRHPGILHIDRGDAQREKRSTNGTPTFTSTESAVSSALVSLGSRQATGAGSKECALAVVPVQVRLARGSQIVQTYAFLDPGSSATFCTEALMTRLNARGKKTGILLKTLGQERAVNSYKITGLEVAGLNSDIFLDLPDVYTQQTIPVTKDNVPKQQELRKWPHLNDVSISSINAEVELLIGVNAPKALEPWRIINSKGNGPYAVETLLGWVVNGPLSSSPTSVDEHGRPCMSVNRISIEKLEEILVDQYNQDFAERHYDERPEMSLEDKQFLEIASTSAVLRDGHYHLKLPFRRDDVSMPNNRLVAEQRAAHLLRKFKKDHTFFEEYRIFMQNVIMQGHAEVVPQDQLDCDKGKVWYLPHHGVHHRRKKTLRVVFDCTANFGGTSLNQELLQGPNLTNTLLGVLLRFRQGRIALMADIQGMFHQVKVAREDVNFLRFLWWPDGDLSQRLSEHRMTVHLFGAVSSPSCATFALLKTANDHQSEYPSEVIDTIRNNFYVDDCLKAAETEEQAVSLYRDLTEVCAKGGFRLTKWVSNCRSVLSFIPEEDRATEVKIRDLDREHLPMERALGAQWDVEHDTFTFSTAVKKQPTTRRGVLSIVNSVYDPLGFLGPVILNGKRILQDLCKIKLGWDEEIPEVLARRWLQWVAELQQLGDFHVDRCLTPNSFGEIKTAQLHHFCDASEVGYGTVSYLRLTSKSNSHHSAFAMGKARVAPLKQTTIPRLELTAAVLAVRIDRMLKTELQFMWEDSVFWSDSTTVLKYIANTTTRFQTFVANRVSTIRDMSQVSQWRHISSGLNPADDASRGLGAEALLRSGRWLSGPDFLSLPESQWPRSVCELGTIADDDPEKRLSVCTTVVKNNPTCSLIEHFSSWASLRRAVAWILRLKKILRCLSQERKENQRVMSTQETWCGNAGALLKGPMERIKTKLPPQDLSVDDMAQAEEAVVRFEQEQSFHEELTALRKGVSVKKSSSIYRLDPILQNGILRIGGRLSRSALPEEVKHPAILPKDGHASTLILRWIHEITGHGGRNHILSRLRRQYWIPQANSAARTIMRQCHLCRRQRGKAGEQIMADLPTGRITPDLPPFTHVGTDYFGPIDVKRGRGTVKRYGVIFTCLACRAIHLEVAYSLDTDSCINALRRFICRRGQVKEIRSDNGTNFVGSARELKEALEQVNGKRIEKTLLQEGITWKFNPPHGAHHGGVWERLIKQVKSVLQSVLKQQTLDDEALQTAFCEVEAILNDRPITPASEDPGDLEALTPNHLIQLKGKPILPPGLFNKEDTYVRRRWRHVQYIADLFWRRWTREYLPMLQKRQKWNEKRRNFIIGDVVLIVDNQAPRNCWPMGRIIKTMPDSKGFVRRVLLKTKTKDLERPVDKICLLLEAE